MKCPWCTRDVGIPPIVNGTSQCPYCMNRIIYAFNGRRVLYGYCVAVPAAILLTTIFPGIGAVIIILAIAMPLVWALYLERFFS